MKSLITFPVARSVPSEDAAGDPRSSQDPWWRAQKGQGLVSVCISQMRKLRLQEVGGLAQGHSVNRKGIGTSSYVSLTLRPPAMNTGASQRMKYLTPGTSGKLTLGRQTWSSHPAFPWQSWGQNPALSPPLYRGGSKIPHSPTLQWNPGSLRVGLGQLGFESFKLK